MAAIGMDGDGVTSEGGDDIMKSEGDSDSVTSDEDDDIMASEGGGERQRVCYKHERAIPIESTVQDLDLREEGEWAGPGREMGMGSGGPGREMGVGSGYPKENWEWDWAIPGGSGIGRS